MGETDTEREREKERERDAKQEKERKERWIRCECVRACACGRGLKKRASVSDSVPAVYVCSRPNSGVKPLFLDRMQAGHECMQEKPALLKQRQIFQDCLCSQIHRTNEIGNS